MLKVDMRKSYDSIEWGYLKQVLIYMKFPSMFVDLIYQCVNAVSYSVLINGYPSVPFPTKRGLEQGNPLSPYLFVLFMEYLIGQGKQLQYYLVFNFHP